MHTHVRLCSLLERTLSVTDKDSVCFIHAVSILFWWTFSTFIKTYKQRQHWKYIENCCSHYVDGIGMDVCESVHRRLNPAFIGSCEKWWSGTRRWCAFVSNQGRGPRTSARPRRSVSTAWAQTCWDASASVPYGHLDDRAGRACQKWGPPPLPPHLGKERKIRGRLVAHWRGCEWHVCMPTVYCAVHAAAAVQQVMSQTGSFRQTEEISKFARGETCVFGSFSHVNHGPR